MKNILNIIVIIMVVGFFVGCGAQVDMKGYIDGSKIEVRVEKVRGEPGGSPSTIAKWSSEPGGAPVKLAKLLGEPGGIPARLNKEQFSEVDYILYIKAEEKTVGAFSTILVSYDSDTNVYLTSNEKGSFELRLGLFSTPKEISISTIDNETGSVTSSVNLSL